MFQGNIKRLAKDNTNFRHVLYTGTYSQLVLMSLAPGEDIGEEIHPNTDQMLFVADGEGLATVDGSSYEIEKHAVVCVPAGSRHNIKNTGDEDLKLYTMYAPPAHVDGAIHVTKEDAERQENVW